MGFYKCVRSVDDYQVGQLYAFSTKDIERFEAFRLYFEKVNL